MSQQLNSKRNEKTQWDDEGKQVDFNVEELPSRKEKHKNSRIKTRGDKRKKKKKIRFPLVRIWLFLFLLLVVLVTTYPFWG